MTKTTSIQSKSSWVWLGVAVFLCHMFYAGTQPVNRFHESNTHMPAGADGRVYLDMAKQIPGELPPPGIAPYVYRIGAPFAVAAVAKSLDWVIAAGFDRLDVACNVASVLLLFAFLRRSTTSGFAVTLVILLFLLGPYWPTRYSYFQPLSVDAFVLLGMVATLLAIEWFRDKPSWERALVVTLITCAGVTIHELLLLPGLSLAVAGERNSPPSSLWPQTQANARSYVRLPGLTGIGVLIGLQIWITPTTSPFSWQAQLEQGLSDASVIRFGLAWFAVFGPVLGLALFQWRTTLGVLRARPDWSLCLVVLTALAWVAGVDRERLLVFASPIVGVVLARSLTDASALWTGHAAGALMVLQIIWTRAFLPIGAALPAPELGSDVWARLGDGVWTLSPANLASHLWSPTVVRFNLWAALLAVAALAGVVSFHSNPQLLEGMYRSSWWRRLTGIVQGTIRIADKIRPTVIVKTNPVQIERRRNVTATLLRDLFGFNPGTIWRRLSLFLLVLLVLGVPEWRARADSPGRLVDGSHATVAIELAMTRSFCGAPSATTPQYRVADYFRDHPEDVGKALREVAREMAGSVENYCAASEPFLNNENSLTLIEVSLLRLEPNLSLEALGRRLHALRIAMLMFFAAILVVSGASVFVSVTVFLLGAVASRTVGDHSYSLYPFLNPFLLFLCAVYGTAWSLLRSGRWRLISAVAVVTGALTGFGTNLRTSYLPLYLSLFVIAIGFATREWQGNWRVKSSRVAVMAVVFGMSFWGFQYWFIDQYLPRSSQFNASYHTAAHPLVLSLALPPSELSRREGIEWNDEVGRRIALRIDPQATYLGKTYDRALFRYYRGLWATAPAEMLGLYVAKFKMTGVPIIEALRNDTDPKSRALGWLMLPLSFVQNGFLLIGMSLGIAATAFFASRPASGSFAVMLTMLTTTGALLLIESAIIMPFYNPQYHGYLFMFFPLISLLGLQSLMDLELRPPKPAGARKTVLYFDSISGDFADRMNPFDVQSRLQWFANGFDRFPIGSTVLDVGSGLGQFADLARTRGARVVPFDIASSLVMKLKTRYPMAVCGSATELPFPDSSFDAVTSSECIEHTPDPAAAVSEMLRVLRPGGHLYLTTPNLIWRWSVTLAELLGVRRFEGIENWLSRAALEEAIVRTGAVVELSQGLHVMPFQFRPLWPVIAWINKNGQSLRAVMINQCWIARK